VISTVAVSGPDNVGKSTQIRLLARQAGLVDAGPLDAHDPRWADAHGRGLADWWFGGVTVEQVTDVLACSYSADHRTGRRPVLMRVRVCRRRGVIAPAAGPSAKSCPTTRPAAK